MAIGKGLRYTLNRIGTVKHQDGQLFARTRHMLAFLGSHGIFCGMTCDVNGPIDREMRMQFDCRMLGRPAILTTPSRVFKGAFHYVFWDGSVVRDPSPLVAETTALEDYQFIEIIPLTYIDES